MMRLLAAALLVSVIGCSSSEEGKADTPPTLEVTSPARGTFADADTVTVSGRATDKEGPVKVTVGGMAVTPAADGTFTATVPVTPGVDLIETHAIDSAGTDVRDVRAVLAGTLGPTDGTAKGHVGARAGVTALRAVGNAVAATAKTIDFTAAAQALNPVYNNTGCLGAKIDITSISLTNVGVNLAPQTNVLATDVTIDNLDVRLHADFKVACIGGSTTITIRSSKAHVHGDLAAAITAGKITTSLPATAVTLDNFSIDVGGVPGAIESLLKDQARSGVEKALTSAIKSKVPPIADKALAGLIAKPVTASLLGHDMTIGITPTKVSITPSELFVTVDTTLRVAGGEGGTFLTTDMALTSATMGSSQGLGIALDDDIVNQLFAGLWAADAFDYTVSIDTIPSLGAVLDDDARSVELKLSLPPTASTDSGELELAIGDLMISVKDDAGAELQSIAVSITTTVSAEPSQTGKVLLTVGAPTVYAQVLAQTAAVDDPLTDQQVEALISGVWGLIGVKADDALSKLPMPTIAGISLGAPTVTTSTGYVLADMSVN
ncbi:MAG TPA: hypothetical protein VFV99_32715 [Kofleriaceae bacterium]|nr:hypothetical protein [Kofleriaceae bacterium]